MDWSEILDEVNGLPTSKFFRFIWEYVNYDSQNSGFPAGYFSIGMYKRHADSWITDAQADVMDKALLSLKAQAPFAFRVFFKRHFQSMPLKQMMQISKLRLEYMRCFQWDGSLEELQYQLERAYKFLFKKLQQLTKDLEDKG